MRAVLLLGLRTSSGARVLYIRVRVHVSLSVYSQVESFVRGHHVFNRVWSPTVGEQLCKREASNMACMLWQLYAWGHKYTYVRVHVVYVHRYMDTARADCYW